MRVVLLALVLMCAAVVLRVGWGPVPEGRLGGWVLVARARLRPPTADDLYRLAERSFEAGDFEKSHVECQRALQMDPGHAPSRALFTEVAFILGQGKSYPGNVDYGPYMLPNHYQHLLIEIDHALERADRFRVTGDREAAVTEVRKVLEYIKWMPESVEFNSRRDEADLLKIRLTGP